jgi:hypothetical protein
VAVTTLSNYRNAVVKYVIPFLGGRQLYTLDKRAIHDLYRHLMARGGRNGKALSAETVRHVHRTLMKALKDLGVSIEGVRQPRPTDREEKGRKGVWTAQQCATFLMGTADDRLYAAWALAVVCGMRRGELAGLKWSKVDLDVGVVYVHWQRAVASGEVEGGVIEKEPEGKSRRSIAIGPALVALLRAHLERQRAEEELAGVVYRRGGYVFCKEDGNPYHPNSSPTGSAICASRPACRSSCCTTPGTAPRPSAPTMAFRSTPCNGGLGTLSPGRRRRCTPTSCRTQNVGRPRLWKRRSSAARRSRRTQ